MIKLIATTAIALAIASPALAQGRGVSYETETGRIRRGTTCELNANGFVYRGRCDVGRAWEGDRRVIRAGSYLFSIRPDGSGGGRFFQLEEDDEGEYKSKLMGYVHAEGSCWVGNRLHFCAR